MTNDNASIAPHGDAARLPRRDGLQTLRAAPIFVLANPQMGENIGATARAMLNFGISALRLSNPRDGWPNPKAGAMASGASVVIDKTEVFETVGAALADCSYVLATTARPREILLPVFSPDKAAAALAERIAQGEKCAVLFGGERAGLTNDEIMLADGIISIPVNPAFASLNLAQAANIIAYEWARIDGRESFDSMLDHVVPASKQEFEHLLDHLFSELEQAGFFFPPEKRDVMERNLRVALSRAAFSENEVRTLRGVIKALVKGRGRALAARQPGTDTRA